ncbi:MAG: YeaH/YhbH family protein [Pseudomonadota bacterium]|nr:YeaH/YhbH family protein [Pseudomonadota bacterium]
MSYIIDRRLNGKNKSTVNRQRFLRRYRQHIKEAVADSVNRRSITDMDRGEQISIPTRNTHEPVITHGPGGKQHRVFPGNKEFNTGDELEKPESGGGGSGSGQASDQGEGEDDFSFYITKDEFLNYLFDDLALPNMIKKTLSQSKDFKTRRAGFVSEGTPNNLSVVRSLRNAHARRIGMTVGKRKKLKELKQELAALEPAENDGRPDVVTLMEQIDTLEKKLKSVPFLDDLDLRYRSQVKVPTPSSKAVMFCLMDVSGSMTQDIKDIAKRFYILLYLFLQKNYEHIELVFIRHHTSAKEVDEQDFFYSRETGGTIVSSALKLMKEIIDDRYTSSEWNIYAAQASDGDNWDDDSPLCAQLLEKQILPQVQYFSYIEITPNQHQALWESYSGLQKTFPHHFAMAQIRQPGDIYPVFRDLFAKDRYQEAV